MAGLVIQATGRTEFEDSLRTGVSLEATGALGAAAPILESISNPSGGAGWSWVGCGCQKDLISDQIPICKFQSAWFRVLVVLNYSCYVVLGLNRSSI